MTNIKLPPHLPTQQLSTLEPSLGIESCIINQPQWASQIARRVTFDTIHLVEPDLTAAQLRESGWSDVLIEGGELGGLNLSNSSWRRMEVKQARLSGIIMTETELKDVAFQDIKLDLANFRFAKLAHTTFVRCNLRDIDFAGAQLESIIFQDCDLSGADFSGAHLKHVDLRTSHIEALKGLDGLKGAILSYDQLMMLAPELAAHSGIIIKND